MSHNESREEFATVTLKAHDHIYEHYYMRGLEALVQG